MAGDAHDLAVAFRVCQIWFSHSSQPEVNTALAGLFKAVSSHKFLCLVYQIASRLGGPSEHGSAFQVRCSFQLLSRALSVATAPRQR